MEYAIVDIETTGSNAASSNITEIAIYIHDGEKVTGKYETLINPQRSIPRHIEALTGITNEMVESAPSFSDVAYNIYKLLTGKVFVAHSVNFDYCFLHYHLSKYGYNLHVAKLCTVRMSRKIFPGMYSYNLGKLCNNLDIKISNRHRAGGDASATVALFEMLLQNDKEQIIPTMLKKGSREQMLPPHVDKSDFDKIPSLPGVYYFKNKYKKIIYIGKAKNLRKRVLSHFTGNRPDKRRQDFMREIFYIEHQPCATELIAMIIEILEIKKIWPKYNYAAKHYEPKYGLFFYEDAQSYLRLGIGKFNRSSLPAAVFYNRDKARNKLYELIKEYNLCTELCFAGKCSVCENNTCFKLDKARYNQRVTKALTNLQANKNRILIEKNEAQGNNTYVLTDEKYIYIGSTSNTATNNIEALKETLTCYSANDFVLNLIDKYSAIKNQS